MYRNNISYNTDFMVCSRNGIALSKVKRSTIYKVKYGIAKLSITVQVHIENDSEKSLVI